MEERGTEQKKIVKQKKLERDKKYVKFSRIKRKIFKHIWLLRGALLGIFLVGVYLFFVLVGGLFKNTRVSNFFSLAKSFVFTPEEKIGSIEGRTNVLILGKGGENHETPDLTDTIIFASISHRGKGISLVSLPRDIWVPKLRAKLNSAYHWGNQRQVGGGLILTKATVEEIMGEPVYYGLVIDFSGFKEIVDVLAGIEVDVENSFVDEKYPIAGKENDNCGGDPEYACRYETITFEEGLQIMDGETALKFVRSRNAEGEEGTDIARAKRQEKVITAIQKKVLSPDILLSPKKVSFLLGVTGKHLETDINQEAAAILVKRLLQSRKNINSYVLDEEFLVNPPRSPRYDNLYVFIPKEETWEKVHKWIDSLLP